MWFDMPQVYEAEFGMPVVKLTCSPPASIFRNLGSNIATTKDGKPSSPTEHRSVASAEGRTVVESFEPKTPMNSFNHPD